MDSPVEPLRADLERQAERERYIARTAQYHPSHAWSVLDRSFTGARLCQRCGAHSDTGAGVQPCPRDPTAPRSDAAILQALHDHTGEMEAAGYPAADLALEQRHEEGLSLLEQRHAAEPPPVRAAPPTRNGQGAPKLSGFLFTAETLLDSMRVAEAEERAKIAVHVGDLTLASAARHYALELRRHIYESGYDCPWLPAEGG